MAQPETSSSAQHPRLIDPARDPFIVSDARSIAASYSRFLWRHRMLFVALPVLFALAAAAWAATKARLYSARMTVAVSSASDQSATIVASFRPYLENNEIVDQVLKEFKLDAPPFNLTRTTLLNDRYSVEPVRNTNLVRVQLRLEDPAVAAAVLQRVGERAAELVRRTSVDLGAQAQKSLEAAYESAEERLRKTNADVQEFKKRVQIDILRKDVDRTLASRGELENLSVFIAQERSRLAQAEADLKAMTQQGNPVYQELATEAAKTRANLAGFEAQRRELARLEAGANKQVPLLARLYDAEQELSDLEARQDIARAVFKEAASNFELARVRAQGTQARLAVVDAPLPPDHPEPRRLGTSAVYGAAIGFFVALAVAVFLGSPTSTRALRREPL